MVRRRGRRSAPPPVSGSELLAQQLDLLPHRVIPEYKFAAGEREWRADFAIPDLLLLLEYEGLPTAFTKSRHTTRAGYVGDIAKYNFATARGWHVLRYHWDSINQETVQSDVESVIDIRGGHPSETCPICEHVFLINIKQPFARRGDKPICLVCTQRKHWGVVKKEELRMLFSARSPKRLPGLDRKQRGAGLALLGWVFDEVGEIWEERLSVVLSKTGQDWLVRFDYEAILKEVKSNGNS